MRFFQQQQYAAPEAAHSFALWRVIANVQLLGNKTNKSVSMPVGNQLEILETVSLGIPESL
jgi:hypothetical protein